MQRRPPQRRLLLLRHRSVAVRPAEKANSQSTRDGGGGEGEDAKSPASALCRTDDKIPVFDIHDLFKFKRSLKGLSSATHIVCLEAVS